MEFVTVESNLRSELAKNIDENITKIIAKHIKEGQADLVLFNTKLSGIAKKIKENEKLLQMSTQQFKEAAEKEKKAIKKYKDKNRENFRRNWLDSKGIVLSNKDEHVKTVSNAHDINFIYLKCFFFVT